jgi:type II secretory pathway component PulK
MTERKKAITLVAVLWTIVLLTAIVSVLAQTSRLDTRMCMADAEQTRCRWACKAGVETAISILNDDAKESDSLSDTWNIDTDDMNDVEMDGCTFGVQIIDEASKLNINNATSAQLSELPGMRPEIVDCILDWRDSDDIPNPAGAEASYYMNLKPAYEIRNGPFRTIRELLEVKGVTEELFYGPAVVARSRQNYDANLAPGSDDGGDKGFFDYLTCYSYDLNKDAQGNKRTNINKATDQDMIKALSITSGQAKWIVNNRGSGYKSIADILSDGSGNSGQTSSNTANSDANSRATNNSSAPTATTQGQNAPGGQKSGDANVPEPIYTDTFIKIADKITISDRDRIRGMVNVNTADRVVLVALLEGDQVMADNIIAYRTNSATGLTSIGELLQVNSMTVQGFKKIANLVTVRSNVFMIKSKAKSLSTNATMRYEVVIDRDRKPTAILYWRQGGTN